MKISFILNCAVVLAIINGCDGINETQQREISSSLDCYLELNNALSAGGFQKELENLSYQHFEQGELPFRIPDVKYRMIPREHIFTLLKMTDSHVCRHKLDSLGDFAGIRFISSNYISYEICRIPQSPGKYGGGHTWFETHRLIYNSSGIKFEKDDFLEKREEVSHYEQLMENWTYVVSTAH